MATVQSSYSENIAVASNGLPADADFTAQTYQSLVPAGIPFGVAVTRSGANRGVVLSGGSVFAGVTLRDVALDADQYAQGDTVGVITRGRVWVVVDQAVTAGQDVTRNSTTGTLSSRSTSGSQLPINGAVWETSALEGELAKLNLTGFLPSVS